MNTNKTNNESFYEKLNIPYVDIARAKELCKINLNCGFVPCLIGEAGIGKTALCRQLIKEYNATGTFFYLAHMEREDIGGIPFPNKEKTAYRYLCEESIHEISKLKNTHFLVLDEWNRGTKDVMNAVFTLMEQRRFGSVTLPENIKIIATMNPSEEEYLVNETENDPAFRRRLAWIGVYNSVNAWLQWATEENLDEDIRKYIATNPAALYDNESKNAGKVYANPAAWERISKLRRLAKDLPLQQQQEIYAGHIGQSQAVAFIDWLIYAQDSIDLEILLTNFEQIRKKIQSILQNEEKRTLITKTVESCILWLVSKTEYPPNIGDNVGKFLSVLPEELKMLFFTMLAKSLQSRDSTHNKLLLNQLILSEIYRKEFAKLTDIKEEITKQLNKLT